MQFGARVTVAPLPAATLMRANAMRVLVLLPPTIARFAPSAASASAAANLDHIRPLEGERAARARDVQSVRAPTGFQDRVLWCSLAGSGTRGRYSRTHSPTKSPDAMATIAALQLT
jgi:hypothetical protein